LILDEPVGIREIGNESFLIPRVAVPIKRLEPYGYVTMKRCSAHDLKMEVGEPISVQRGWTDLSDYLTCREFSSYGMAECVEMPENEERSAG
jgi:hypothetical protein